MDPDALLHACDKEARSLLAAAASNWGAPVPPCPEWDAAELVRHTGAVLGWIPAVVASGERISRRSLEPAPQDTADLASWYLTRLDRALDVLGSADPASETWTFSSSGDRRVSWWYRRLAVEVAVHRWDVESGASGGDGPFPRTIDGEVAAAGVEEFIIEFLPGLLAQEGIEGLTGSLHLHAVDGPSEWWIDLDDGGSAVAEHAKADTAVRGTRSDLLLWLTNRGPLESLEIFGAHAMLERWGQLRL
jgi:uncharacterized protein (TIGR03083 family)